MPERSAQKPFHRKKIASETPSEPCGPWPYFLKPVRLLFGIHKDLVRFAHEVMPRRPVFSRKDYAKKYGPVTVPDQDCTIFKSQQFWIQRLYSVWPVIRYRPSWGIWVGSTCTRQCQHAWAIGRGLPSDRHIPSARRGIYPVSRGITRSIGEVYLHVSSFQGA